MDSETEEISSERQIILELGKAVGELKKGVETLLYETNLRRTSDLFIIQSGEGGPEVIRRIIDDTADNITKMEGSIDESIPSYSNRANNLRIANDALQRLLNSFKGPEQRYKRLHIPPAWVILTEYTIYRDRVGDNFISRIFYDGLKDGTHTLESLKRDYEENQQAFGDEEKYSEMLEEYRKRELDWLLDPLASWTFSEERYSLLDIASERGKNDIVYGAHPVVINDDTREKMARELEHDDSLSYRLLVKLLHDLRPNLDDLNRSPYRNVV